MALQPVDDVWCEFLLIDRFAVYNTGTARRAHKLTLGLYVWRLHEGTH